MLRAATPRASPGGPPSSRSPPRRDRGGEHGQGERRQPAGPLLGARRAWESGARDTPPTPPSPAPRRQRRAARPQPRDREVSRRRAGAAAGRAGRGGGKEGARPALQPPPHRFVLPGPAAAAQEQGGRERGAAGGARPPQPAMAHSPVAVQVPGMQVSSARRAGPKMEATARARPRAPEAALAALAGRRPPLGSGVRGSRGWAKRGGRRGLAAERPRSAA